MYVKPVQRTSGGKDPLRLFEIICVDNQGNRSVVFGRDLHICAELTVLRREAQPLAFGQKLLVERNGNVGLSGADEARRRA